MLEYIVVRNIVTHLEEPRILIYNQYGLCTGHSCETQFIIATQDLAKYLDNKIQVDATILDFSKAFNKHCALRQLYYSL